MHFNPACGQVKLPVLLVLLAVALVADVVTPEPIQADPTSPAYSNAGPFRFAMVHVLAGVNPHDAQVAVKLNWSKHLANTFNGLASEFDILSDVQTAKKLIAEGKLHGLSMGVAQFLELRKTAAINPVFISSRLATPLESYLLLVRRESNWQSIGQLPERRLVVETSRAPNIGHMWLETLLHQRNLPSSGTYFSQITEAVKPSRIVLPVFFGQADACLVPESAYLTMTELNPQIDRRLAVLARSPGFIKTIHCATELMPEHMVARFVERGVSMEDTFDGRQLLLIFHVKKNFVFQPEFLDASERVFQVFEQIAGRPHR